MSMSFEQLQQKYQQKKAELDQTWAEMDAADPTSPTRNVQAPVVTEQAIGEQATPAVEQPYRPEELPGFEDLGNQPNIPTPMLDANVQAQSQPIESAQPLDVPTAANLANQPSAPKQPEATAFEQVVGAGETALSMASGMTSGVIGTGLGAIDGIIQAIASGTMGTEEGSKLIKKTADDYATGVTYSPKTQAGQDQTAAVADTVDLLGLDAIPFPMANNIGVMAKSATRVLPKTAAGMSLNIDQGKAKSEVIVDALADNDATAYAKAIKPNADVVKALDDFDISTTERPRLVADNRAIDDVKLDDSDMFQSTGSIGRELENKYSRERTGLIEENQSIFDLDIDRIYTPADKVAIRKSLDVRKQVGDMLPGEMKAWEAIESKLDAQYKINRDTVNAGLASKATGKELDDIVFGKQKQQWKVQIDNNEFPNGSLMHTRAVELLPKILQKRVSEGMITPKMQDKINSNIIKLKQQDMINGVIEQQLGRIGKMDSNKNDHTNSTYLDFYDGLSGNKPMQKIIGDNAGMKGQLDRGKPDSNRLNAIFEKNSTDSTFKLLKSANTIARQIDNISKHRDPSGQLAGKGRSLLQNMIDKTLQPIKPIKDAINSPIGKVASSLIGGKTRGINGAKLATGGAIIGDMLGGSGLMTATVAAAKGINKNKQTKNHKKLANENLSAILDSKEFKQVLLNYGQPGKYQKAIDALVTGKRFTRFSALHSISDPEQFIVQSMIVNNSNRDSNETN